MSMHRMSTEYFFQKFSTFRELQAGGSTEPIFFVAKEDSLAERLMIVEREEIIEGISSWKTQPGVDEELS